MSPPQRFTLTAEHVTLLRAANITWHGDEGLWGVVGFDAKRPLGVSGFQDRRIHELLGGDPHAYDAGGSLPAATVEEYTRIYRGLDKALQIVLVTGQMEPGDYEASAYGSDWHRADGAITDSERLARFHDAGWRIADDGDPYQPED